MLDLLSEVAPTDGVAGNNDPPELVALLGRRKVVEIGGARLGLTHGDLGPGRTTPQRALRAFADEPDMAAVLFGHSHIPLLERLPKGGWLMNPGSPTDRRRQQHYSWGLVTILEGTIVDARINLFHKATERASSSQGIQHVRKIEPGTTSGRRHLDEKRIRDHE